MYKLSFLLLSGLLFFMPIAHSDEFEDYKTTQAILKQLKEHSNKSFERLIVSSKNGVVKLSGRLANTDELAEVASLIQKVDGVKDIKLDLIKVENTSEKPEKTLEKVIEDEPPLSE